MAKSKKEEVIIEEVSVSTAPIKVPEDVEHNIIQDNKALTDNQEVITINYPNGYNGRKDNILPEGITFVTTKSYADKLRKKGIVKK